MSGYKIRFNGLDRLYDHYKTELNEAAQQSWQLGSAILGKETEKLESSIAKKLLKYEPQYNFDQGIRKYYEWLQNTI